MKPVCNVFPSNVDGMDWKIQDSHSALNIVEPTELEFSRRNQNISIQNQGNIGACVGMSGKVVLNSIPKFKDDNLSSMWVYKNAKYYDEWKGETYSGTSITGACEGLRIDGVCLEEYYPYNKLNEDITPAEFAKDDAAKRKIHAYYFVDVNDENCKAKVKRLIKNENLWWSFLTYDYVYNIPGSGIIDSEQYLNSENTNGGHAVSIIGWKTINGKLYWECQNSWDSTWGDNGFFFIDHDLAKQISISGFYYLESFEEADFVAKKQSKQINQEKVEKKKKKKQMLIAVGAVVIVIIGACIFFL